MQKILFLLSCLFLITACEPKVEMAELSAGEADFSGFVSLGDSYTAGYTNGALSRKGQVTSFAALMAQQINLVLPQQYNIPLLPEGKSVGASLKGEMIMKSGSDGPVPFTTVGDPGLLTNPQTWINANAPYQNMGIPGARVFHLNAPGYGKPGAPGSFNPFYARFASQPGLSTVLSEVLAQDPRFFSLWIGTYDVLAYGLAGGQGESGIGLTDITPAALFEQSYDLLLRELTSSGAKGVVATIPPIKMMPFFNVIAPGMLVLDATQAAALESAYVPYNKAAASLGLDQMSFSTGANFWVIEDSQHPLGMRQIKTSEKLLLSLPRENLETAGWGTQIPIPDEYVLDMQELQSIDVAISNFNSAIVRLADNYNLALVDMSELFEKTATGYTMDGVTYSNGYVTGGVFSLDGIHPCGRGSAIIANAFIASVNNYYNCSIPMVTVNDLWGIEFP